MDRKYLIKIINEEVSGYNYLGKDEIDNERELHNLINNKDFQRRFIEDVIANKNIKYGTIDTQVDGEYRTSLRFYYEVDVTYTIPEYTNPIKFIVGADANNVAISVDSKMFDENNRWVAPSERCVITYVDWDKIGVYFNMPDGHYMDTDQFTPDIFNDKQLKERFLKVFLGPFIEEVEECQFP
jgi:hypothetical protein